MFKRKKKTNTATDKEKLLFNFPSRSRYAEAYRTLRTNLFFSLMEKEIDSVVITSAVEKEGKTNTAANLAYTIAQSDRRVLLMDCDLRRPHLTSMLVESREKGVTHLLNNDLGARLSQGSLKAYSIADLIQLTKLQQRSCCLEVENPDTQVAIYFDKGRMTDIYWKNRPESKKLANTLIRDNQLTEEEARLALGHQKKSVQRLGSILYTMGFVSKKELAKALSIHTIQAIRAVSAMRDGRFTVSGTPNGNGLADIGHDIDFEKRYNEFAGDAAHFIHIRNAVDLAVMETETDNLYVLPAGSVPPNPSELINSKRMEFLVGYLKSHYDFLVIDTPPVMPASDAILMAPRTDGTLLVMKSGNTERKIVHGVLDQYKAANQPILGAVLNDVDMKKEGYYQYYEKYYASYYGE